VAYTYIRAIVAQAYATCVGTPCQPAIVESGSHLPAVPINALYAGLTWNYDPVGFSATFDTQGRAQIYADDRNTAAAAGYWVANLRAGLEQATQHWRFSEFARLDNLFNRSYVGSVIVNESNQRYFEAAPGRTAYLMFNAAWRTD
jgi:iron complex outermembrane receptor protein